MLYPLIIATLAVAAVDWWAAYTDRKPWEYVFKPLTMVVLIAAALSIDNPLPQETSGSTVRWIIVAALVLSLAGDVFLMLGERLFLQGLVSFLFAHIAYIVAFAVTGVGGFRIVVGVIIVGVVIALAGPPIVEGARQQDPMMGVAVSVYLTVISLMVIVAIGNGNPWAVAGAALFCFSDACIGWDRFVKPLPARDLLVMVTYHLGQIGLVLSLTI